MTLASPDPFGIATAASRSDPYPAYARMREQAPVHFCEPWSAWVVTRHADVAAAFRDKRFSAARASAFAARLSEPQREYLAPLVRNIASWALLNDAPTHTRLRGLVNKAFTPRVVERLQPAIVELTRLLVTDTLHGEREGTFDVMTALAGPLPVLVIGDLLGLPREDRHLLKKWSDALAAFLGAVRATPLQIDEARSGIVEMEAYFRDAIASRRRAQRSDLLSALLAAQDGGSILSDQELVSTCSMVLFGGHETTTNLIANGLYSLLRHPDELARLREAPELIEGAVEELLRFESPVQRMGRIALGDVDLGGATIPSEGRVFLVMGAAHRDPAAFREPDRLDVARPDVRHLAFGLGAHYCVGAALGRAEACAALRELLTRFPSIELRDAAPVWTENATIRGLETLRIGVRAS